MSASTGFNALCASGNRLAAMRLSSSRVASAQSAFKTSMTPSSCRTMARVASASGLTAPSRAIAPRSQTSLTSSLLRTQGMMAPSVLSYASLAGLRHNSTTAETHEHIVFIGNLSHTITSEKLRELFGQFGEVVSSNVPLRATGKPKGFGFVNFATAEAAQAALALNGKDVDGWTIRVNPAEPRTERPAPPSNTLYVDGFATTNQDADLRKMFEPFGVERVRMGEDRKDRRVLGFAHVYVKDQAAAEEAIAKLNGQDVEGRKLRVSFAAPLKKRA